MRLHPSFALRVWLKRRERRLVLEERAAVAAALSGAPPELRARLEQLLARAPDVTRDGSGVPRT